ncbi:MAG: FGGY-family carbohydrate kinase [Actinomycetota bacterium]|nr:FGGY-family carbohydrate kinase [Actinomycetota bacterium]
MGYSNEGGAEGSNLFIKNITGMWIIQQCRAKWIKDGAKKMPGTGLVGVSPGPLHLFAGFIDVNNPAFTPPQLGYASGNKGITAADISLKVSAQKRPGLLYEGLVLKFKHEVKSLEKLTGQKLELLHLIGGGTKDRLLCQWTADATGIPVIAGPPERTSVRQIS